MAVVERNRERGEQRRKKKKRPVYRFQDTELTAIRLTPIPEGTAAAVCIDTILRVRAPTYSVPVAGTLRIYAAVQQAWVDRCRSRRLTEPLSGMDRMVFQSAIPDSLERHQSPELRSIQSQELVL